MSELETLGRNLFARSDSTTVDFKVFLGSNRDVLIEDVCSELNKVVAQDRNGMLKKYPSVDGHLQRTNVADFLSRF